MAQLPPGPPPAGSPPPYGPPAPYGAPPQGGPPPGAAPYGAPPYGAPYVVAQPARSSGPSLGLVLGIVGGVVFLGLLGVGALGYFFYANVRGAQDRVRRANEDAVRVNEEQQRKQKEELERSQRDAQRAIDQLERELKSTTDGAAKARIQAQINALRAKTKCACDPLDPLCVCN